jgi:hypothetical protein
MFNILDAGPSYREDQALTKPFVYGSYITILVSDDTGVVLPKPTRIQLRRLSWDDQNVRPTKYDILNYPGIGSGSIERRFITHLVNTFPTQLGQIFDAAKPEPDQRNKQREIDRWLQLNTSISVGFDSEEEE